MTWRRRCALRLTCLLGVVLAAAAAYGQQQSEPTGADWELHALGVPVGERLEAARAIAGGRPVVLAIVGQGGVSETLLQPALGEHATLEYRDGAMDPGTSTHDTAAARVILDLTSRLGVQVRLLVYQPGEPFRDVADAMAKAGAEADIVAFFQSFWGPDVSYITDAIAQADGCLFVSPYVEYQSRPTSTCVQAHSAKPWAEGLAHFVTAAPVAYKAPGRILQPASGEEDTEIINFVAPSYYASGAGGTCPAGEVTAAVAAYVMAASPSEPSPAEVVAIMRETVALDTAVLAERLGYDAATAAELVEQIAALTSPEQGPRKLDAAGVLDLWAIHQRLVSAHPPAAGQR
ncbi:MAG: hypothetical protein ACP5KN_10165 [Armatimonadota bacterium]